ncbi:N-acetyltransferase family protein [Rhizobium sp.]
MAVEIRDAQAGDEGEWRALWADHFEFHKTTVEPAVTDSTWRRILDPQSTVAMRVAIVDGKLAGYAIHFAHPSTWVMADDCYLEDLYTDKRFRGRGVGRALMDDLVALSRKNGWAHLYWHCHESNEGARKLYDQYIKADGSVRYRMAISPP